MNGLLLFISVLSVVAFTTIVNKVGKGSDSVKSDTYTFNLIQYIVSFLIFVTIAIFSRGISWFTVLFGIFFGLMTVISNVNKMLAMSIGSMSITVLICTSACIIIPTTSGFFFGESISLIKVLAIALLILFICFATVNKEVDKKIGLKWLIYCTVAFFVGGSIGVWQKIFRATEYKDQTAAFLASAFLVSSLYSLIMAKRNGAKFKVSRSFMIYAVIAGVCVYLMNHINLYLSGVMPAQLFFPLANGIPLVTCSIIAATFFKERFRPLQVVGLVGGIVSLIAICILP